jgi:hypothetical protein
MTKTHRAAFTIVALTAAISAKLSGQIPTPAHAPVPTIPVNAATPAGWVKEFGTMWTFDAPPLAYWKARYNFTPDRAWLDHVRLASIRIPGCSASFVSANGLVMTNHHCGRDCTAGASTADSNYIQTGFAAASLTDEKRCANMYADQLQSVQDVTNRVQKAMTSRVASQQVQQRALEIDRIQKECAKDATTICEVVTFYQGGMYSLYTYHRWTDIRLVMAPEGDIAFYGGDPDNFTYPRYDLDLTLLRVYENGQPLHPTDFLKWSVAGAADGELVFVTGNPGSTGRLLTLSQMEYLRDVDYPNRLASYERQLRAYRAASAMSPEAQRQYQNMIFTLENSRKAVTGYRVGLLDSAIMAKKRAFERDFRQRIAANPTLKLKYGAAWDAITAAEKEQAVVARQLLAPSFGGGSNLLSWAGSIVRIPGQLALLDSMRLAAFRGEAPQRLRQTIATATVDTTFERTALAATLSAWKEALPATNAVLAAALAYGHGNPDSAAAAIVAQTSLTNTDARRALLNASLATLSVSKDPLIRLARMIEPENRRLLERSARLDATISANAALIGQAIFAAYGTSLPPDATFTLRISDGIVSGYPMNGTIAPYKTSMFGLYDRSASFDDSVPFRLPARWKQGREKLDLATPMDFVSTNDIIGGNSGSPVINRYAEIVGLIFDGNIESVPNRFIFTDAVARSVSVSSRAIIEALRKLYDGGRIADELEGH